MEFSKYIGETVIHKTYGNGCIVDMSGSSVVVDFGGNEKKFQFPAGFHEGKFLKLKNASLQADAEKYYCEEKEKKEAEKTTQEAVRKAELEKTLDKIKKGQAERKERIRPLKRILTYGDTFNTHAEALNTCFGFDYKHYQVAYKVLDDSYAVWFPSIAKIVRGEYAATDTSAGWINVISEGGAVLVERNEDSSKNAARDEKYQLDRFVFAKFDTGYRFIGVFRYDKKCDYSLSGYRYELIGNKVDLWTMEITSI